MKKHNRRTGIALLLCLVLSLQMCLPPSAALAEEAGNQDGATEILPEIDYSVSGYDGPYDGNPHSISVSATEGTSVSYASSSGGEYSSQNPAFTEAGEYTVYFMLEKDGCTPTGGSATVKISKGEIDYSVSGYDGTYDGQPHSITLTVSTPDVTVSYASSEDGTYTAANPSFTEAGSYMVYFRLEKEGYQSEEGSVGVQINPVDISDQVRAGLKSSYAYTGSPVQFDLPYDNIKEWSIVYVNSDGEPLDTPVEPGSYTVNISGEGGSYYANVNHTFTIVKTKEEIQYTASGYTGVYDGSPHAITVNVTNEGATVTYAASSDGTYSETNPTYTDAGEYTVYFKIEKPDCETKTGSATVTIAKADVSSQVVLNRQDSYTYTGEPVGFAPSCEGIDEWTYTYYENDTKLDAAPGAPGSYRVEIIGTGVNHTAKVTHAYSIVRTEIQYTASGYTGTYDGEAHSITVSVTTEGATVTYSATEDGEYTETKPAYIEPGDYTVWYRIEKENCDTITGSATVTITPKEIEYTVSGFSGVYFAEEYSITLNILSEGVSATYATSEDGPYTDQLPMFRDAGEYTVWYRLEGTGYRTVEGSAPVTIEKVDYSNRNTTEFPTLILCSGEPVSFAPQIMSAGAGSIRSWTFTYYDENGDALASAPTLPGKYSVDMNGEGTNCFARLHHKFTIMSGMGPIDYSVQGYSGDYDGQPHTISLSVTTSDVTVTYATSEDGPYSAELPTFTEPGEYTVWFRLEKGYSITTGSARVNIAKIDVSDQVVFTAEDSYVYNAKPVPIEAVLNGELPFGDSMELTLSCCDVDGNAIPGVPIDVGTYSVTVSGEGMYCFASSSCNVEIKAPAEQLPIEYSAGGYSGYFDGKAHSITLDIATPGATVRYATSENSEYTAENPGFTQPGSYTVWYRIEKQYHTTVTGSAVVEILEHKDKITYAVEGYSGVYDGETHTIDLQVVTPDVNVTYATSRDGKYKATPPEYFTPGSYTVWFKLEKSGFETCTGSATVTIEKAEQTLYFRPSVMKFWPMPNRSKYTDYLVDIVRTRDGGELSWSSSDPERILIMAGKHDIRGLIYYVPYEEWCNGYVAVITATAAETDYYKAATATYTIMADETIPKYVSVADDTISAGIGNNLTGDFSTGDTLLKQDTDLTLRPVSDLNSKSLLGASSALRKKLMSLAGEGQIGTMTVDACLTDSQTGEEIHNVSGDLLLSFTGDLQQRYLANYENMSCIAVHIKQDSTTETAAPTPTPDQQQLRADANLTVIGSAGTVELDSLNNTDGSNNQLGGIATTGATVLSNNVDDGAPTKVTLGGTSSSDEGVLDFNVSATEYNRMLADSNMGSLTVRDSTLSANGVGEEFGELLIRTSDGLTVAPVGSLSSKVEFIPCKLTREGVLIPDTTTSPFLLIYGPKEAFSNLLTVRAKDGVFTWDGEGHQVAAEPSIEEGTTLWYSLDLENWQTEAPVFTDVLRNEDGSVGSYQVYVLAENPDCDPAVCSYTVTINPAE